MASKISSGSMDANGDGALTLKEVFSAIRGYAKAQIAGGVWEAVDTNGDGFWSLDEVENAIEYLAKKHGVELVDNWRDMVAHVFHEVDANDDGKVSKKELEAAIKEHGYPDFEALVKK